MEEEGMGEKFVNIFCIVLEIEAGTFIEIFDALVDRWEILEGKFVGVSSSF